MRGRDSFNLASRFDGMDVVDSLVTVPMWIPGPPPTSKSSPKAKGSGVLGSPPGKPAPMTKAFPALAPPPPQAGHGGALPCAPSSPSAAFAKTPLQVV